MFKCGIKWAAPGPEFDRRGPLIPHLNIPVINERYEQGYELYEEYCGFTFNRERAGISGQRSAAVHSSDSLLTSLSCAGAARAREHQQPRARAEPALCQFLLWFLLALPGSARISFYGFSAARDSTSRHVHLPSTASWT